MSSTTHQVLHALREYESPNVTFFEPDDSWPIVWERARGVHVWDVEGKRYLDLTAAFGVAAAGHANARVVKAGQKQMARLLHAMGDVHPHRLKAELARGLSRITFERWAHLTTAAGGRPSSGAGTHDRTGGPECSAHGELADLAAPEDGRPPNLARPLVAEPRRRLKVRGPSSGAAKTIFCNSGFEAVEAALKTAMLATGHPGVIAFEGAYHGVGYGALNATHRDHFRAPFLSQLRQFGQFVPFPKTRPALGALEAQIRKLFRREKIGAILVEPIQVRGGVQIPPPEFLPMLRRLCEEQRALLILDEIYTGFGRTGKWFACEHSGTVPDVVCVGKALTGGFPLSACVGRAEVMDAAWPRSTGEAIHTSTFLGHPVGCAMALAQLAELCTKSLIQRSADLGHVLLSALQALNRQPRTASEQTKGGPKLQLHARGLGLLAGVELRLADGRPATAIALESTKQMLHRGFILLPEGEHSNVLGLTPPLTITGRQLNYAVQALREILASV